MIDSRLEPEALPVAAWQILHEVDVARLVVQHTALRNLCVELETCANHLPDPDAVVGAARVSAALIDTLRRHESLEDAMMTSLGDADPAGLASRMWARIRHRRAADRLHAEDLHDALTGGVEAVGPVRFDTLSYMMRCLFDGCLRGIDLEEAAMLLLAPGRLTAAARATLIASLSCER